MQAVILAAGNSSRFSPFNKSMVHKSLVKLMGKTILEHTLLSVKKAGIKDVVIVVNNEEAFRKEVGDGQTLGLTIHYAILDEAKGMGAALLKAEPFLQESFFLLNPQHIDFHLFANELLAKQKRNDLVLLGKKDTHFDLYAFITLENDVVKGVVEKPKQSIDSSLRLIGIYLLNKSFVDLLKLQPEGHYSFEIALDAYAKSNMMYAVETDKEVVTLKYAWDLLKVKDYLLQSISSFISASATVSEDVRIMGNVYIDDGAQVMEGVVIKGPAYIGKNTFVGNNVVLRKGVILEEGAIAGSFLELKNTIFMKNTSTHTGVIEDSILGKDCKIAAGVLTANVRLDRKNVLAVVKDGKIDTGHTALGMIIGDNTRFGIRVSTMPGVIIGNNVVVGPSTTVMENIADNTRVYTKFETVIKKHE